MADNPNSIGLPEFELIATYEDTDGRSLLREVKKSQPPEACPKCGCVGPFYRHTKNERIVQDIPAYGKLCYLKILTGRYKCRECGETFAESFDCVEGKDRLTKRFKVYIQKLCLKDTFSRIAQDNSISVNTVRRCFHEYVEWNEKLLIYKAPRVLGIDEDHVHKIFRFVITDVENRELLDIIPDREPDSILELFRRMPDKHNIKVVTMDMYAPYKKIIKKVLPSAKIVVDHYHVIQLVNRRMDDVRKQAREGMNAAQRKKFLYLSKLMKSNKEDLSVESYNRLKEMFLDYPNVGQAYHLKELVRTMYKQEQRREAGELFLQFIRSVPENCAPMVTVRETFLSWKEEIMNYFDHPYTNAFTEAANKLIKDLNQKARSLDFEQLRYKVLFATKATRLPSFEIDDADFEPSKTFRKITVDSVLASGPTLLEGFGVDIETLAQEFE